MAFLGLITARRGSKAIPGKNMVDLGGTPLVGWTFSAAVNSGLDRVVLSSDDLSTMEIARDWGVEVPFTRPPELSTDRAKSIDVVKHCINELGLIHDDVVLLLQPTSPFRDSKSIKETCSLFEERVDSVFSVQECLHHHPSRALFIDSDGFLTTNDFTGTAFSPRQEVPPVFFRNGAIYAAKVSTILGGSFLGEFCRPIVMDEFSSLDINTLFDLEVARSLVGSRKISGPSASTNYS